MIFKFQYLSENFPNPVMIPALQFVVNDMDLTGILNSARKKAERLNALCNHLKYTMDYYE